MSDTPNSDAVNEIVLEGIQMSMEANAAAMILLNARVAMLAEHVGLDVSTPPLTDVEEKNKTHMLASVGQRMQKIMKMSAALAGAPEPTPAEMADALEQVKNDVWPDGSISGTAPQSEGTQPKSATGRASASEPNAAAEPKTDPFEGSIFEGATPVEQMVDGDMVGEVMNIFAEDGGAQEIVAKINDADEELIRQQQAAEEPLFKSQRVKPDGVTVFVWAEDGFGDVNFLDPEARLKAWQDIVEFYCDSAQASVTENWLTQPQADRLKVEFTRNPDSEPTAIEQEIPMPTPEEVSAGVAQTAAQGDTEITITGISNAEQVMEAHMTSFMVTAARFNMAIGAALLDKRLAQLGMSAE